MLLFELSTPIETRVKIANIKTSIPLIANLPLSFLYAFSKIRIAKTESVTLNTFKSVIKKTLNWNKLAEILQKRVVTLNQIPEMVAFFSQVPDYDKEIFINKKSKTTLESSKLVLDVAINDLSKLIEWSYNSIHDCLISLAEKMRFKNGTVMWPVRIAVSGKSVTPGGAIEILEILGKAESLRRIKLGLEKLS